MEGDIFHLLVKEGSRSPQSRQARWNGGEGGACDVKAGWWMQDTLMPLR